MYKKKVFSEQSPKHEPDDSKSDLLEQFSIMDWEIAWLSKAASLNLESPQDKRALGVSGDTFLENSHGKMRMVALDARCCL